MYEHKVPIGGSLTDRYFVPSYVRTIVRLLQKKCLFSCIWAARCDCSFEVGRRSRVGALEDTTCSPFFVCCTACAAVPRLPPSPLASHSSLCPLRPDSIRTRLCRSPCLLSGMLCRFSFASRLSPLTSNLSPFLPPPPPPLTEGFLKAR